MNIESQVAAVAAQIEREHFYAGVGIETFKARIQTAYERGSLLDTEAGNVLVEYAFGIVSKALTESSVVEKNLKHLKFKDKRLSKKKLGVDEIKTDILTGIFLVAFIRHVLKDRKRESRGDDKDVRQGLLRTMDTLFNYNFVSDRYKEAPLSEIIYYEIREKTDIFHESCIYSQDNKTRYAINPSPDFEEIVEKLLEIDTFAQYKPLICLPKEWNAGERGGYYTEHCPVEMITKSTPEQREAKKYANLGPVYDAMNRVQNTPWKINKGVLNRLLSLSVERNSLGCAVFNLKDQARPAKPDALFVTRKDATNDDWKQISQYERTLARWNTAKAGTVTTQAVLTQSLHDVDQTLYFATHLDTRGRLYFSGDFHPQGSDLAKGLLYFANEKPLGPHGEKWLKGHIASCFGLDKKSLEERVKWVEQNHWALLVFPQQLQTELLGMATGTEWQAIAAALELGRLHDWKMLGNTSETFLSGLVVAFDASCSGIQHLAALTRDKKAGKAVNLTKSDKREDIYEAVAKTSATADLIVPQFKSESETDYLIRAEAFVNAAKEWAEIGIDRGAVKRQVMTFSYGGKDSSRVKYAKAWLLESNRDFKSRINHLSEVLNLKLVEAFKEHLDGPERAMHWIQQAARKSISKGVCPLWVAPTGFPATVAARKPKVKRVLVRLGNQKSFEVQKLIGYEDGFNSTKALAAIAPGYIHSLDAAHLMLTINAMATDFAPVHDSFGVTANEAETLYHVVRRSFMDIYSDGKCLERFAADLGCSDLELPKFGDLDISEVASNQYCFA